ncbi:hypothetical protein EalM132_00110 [Exiguobacterium phage vB_EalM-132]|nr:hypothetical protein EalM132_00110 [Exiguobacterium phage vB_EalM-132]
MNKIHLQPKEKTAIKLILSVMLNLLLTILLAISLTYGAAFNGQYSLGVTGMTDKNIVLLYSETKLLNYWVVSEGVIYTNPKQDFVSWEVDGNAYWSKGTVVVIQVKDPDRLDYDSISERYNATPEQVEGIKKKVNE